MTNLSDLINQCIAEKQGNKEFALFYFDPGDFMAEIGNPVKAVTLGESSGEIRATGETAEEAVQTLLDQIRLRNAS